MQPKKRKQIHNAAQQWSGGRTTHPVSAVNFINALLLKHVQSSKAAQHCQDSLSFTSVSSTKSVCGSGSWGAQGGSALTAEGNSFRKYQTARHTKSTISLSTRRQTKSALFSVGRLALVFLTLTHKTQAGLLLSGTTARYSPKNWVVSCVFLLSFNDANQLKK